MLVFTGKILYKNIPEYYQLADIFTTASKDRNTRINSSRSNGSIIYQFLAIQDDAFVDAINDSNGYLFKNMKDYTNKSVELINNSKLRIQLR
jgi:hypothetical protein